MISKNIPKSASRSIDALRFIYEHQLQTEIPNVTTALRIALTVPVTVASGERSFSKLKLIKNYLRTTMTQERLNALGLISIERDIVHSLDYSQLLKVFAEMKARKIKFN